MTRDEFRPQNGGWCCTALRRKNKNSRDWFSRWPDARKRRRQQQHPCISQAFFFLFGDYDDVHTVRIS